SLNRKDALRRYMFGSDEKISGPVINTSASPASVHVLVSLTRSAADSCFIPMPSRRRSTIVMVPIATANPRMCRTSHTGNAHSFVFSGLLDGSYAKKSAIDIFHLVFYGEAPVVRRIKCFRRTS